MPATHPLQVSYVTDPYVHDFYLSTDEQGTPWNVTGQVWSVRVLDDEYGDYIQLITPTAEVIDGATGHVRATIPQADCVTILGDESSRTVWVRLRNDTLAQTYLVWPVELRP